MKRWIFLGVSSALFLFSIIFYFVGTPVVLDNLTVVKIILLIITLILFFTSLFFTLFYSNKIKIKNLNEKLELYSKLSYQVSEVGEDVINNFPVGIILLSEKNDITWINSFAKHNFDSFLNKKIEELDPRILEYIKEGKEKFVLNINNEFLEFNYNADSNSLYFYDSTEKQTLKDQYFEKIPALGVIYLDNLETALSSMDFSLQSVMKGEYLSTISDWVSKYEGYLKSYNEEKLVFSCFRKNLYKMIEDKFSILDEINEISNKYNSKVTVSIGISSWDVSYEKLGGYSQSAVELAQKRGGDQVVVNIENEKITYYGAREIQEKVNDSRVALRYNAQVLKEYVNAASNVFIMGHTISDTDVLGSQTLLLQMIKQEKEDKVYAMYDFDKLDNTVKKVSQILLEKEPYLIKHFITTQEALKLINENSLLIIVDTQATSLISSKELLEKIPNVVIIDHHRSAEDVIQSKFSYIEPYASSTVELCVGLMQFFNKETPITPLEASIMLSGIIVDTNNFTNRTSTKTFSAAATLRELGGDMVEVQTWLRKDKDRVLLINQLLTRIEVFMNRFAFVKSDEIFEDKVLLSQLADEMLKIDGIDAAFAISRSSYDKVSVSARSGKNINVQIIMEQLGGGGHFSAAACKIDSDSVNLVEQDIKEILSLEYQKDGEKMKVILLEDIKGKGSKRDVLEVASGYANFLMKNNKAILANEENLENLRKQLEKEKQDEESHVNMLKKLKEEIDNKSATIFVKLGREGKMFGSVTTQQIVDSFEKQNHILLDKKKIQVNGEINSVGTYTASVALYKNITATFNIHVVSQE